VTAVEPLALEAVGVGKRYGDAVALRDVDLTLAPGEVVGLLGANGAGKTTFLSIVTGLRAADAGRVLVNGAEVGTGRRTTRRSLGFAPQDLGLYLQLTVRQNLRFFGRLAGLRSKRKLDAAIDEVAAALGLTPLLGRYIYTLSGGEQRRTHTAAAMVHRPALLLLDEPTVGADVVTRAMLLDVVLRLAGEGTAICYTTHYLGEIETLDASVAILAGGRIVARGSIPELTATVGETFVEVELDGIVPPELAHAVVEGVTPTRLRLASPDPGATVARVTSLLADRGCLVRVVNVLRPSLETVYLAMTGAAAEAPVPVAG
jgi:ABC-2 type transport system ATP-binding protein